MVLGGKLYPPLFVYIKEILTLWVIGTSKVPFQHIYFTIIWSGILEK